MGITVFIENNIAKVKEVLGKIQKFGRTHRQIYRRYKHAGFPFRPGYSYDGYFPFTNKKFEFYSIVYDGQNPLNDVVLLPYSERVQISYKALLIALQGLLQDIVSSKVMCIERKVEGIIPSVDYSSPVVLSEDEKLMLPAIYRKFNEMHPIHMRNYLFQFPMNIPSRQDVEWYVELENLMTIDRAE